MALVLWEDVSKVFGAHTVVDSVSLSVDRGEILGILGPSGSGKSTLLRLTAGLESLSGGRILCEGRDVSAIPPHARDFGLMFQDYCLFPHMSVARNIAFGLRMHRMSAERRAERTREMLQLVRMEPFAARSVLTLSGGEQQRVALARSLAPAPRLLMLDEPIGALDAVLRGELLSEVGGILRTVGATAVYVTHDHSEAMAISSRIAVMNAGRIEQVGTPLELVQEPASVFVASFLGLGAVLPGLPALRGGRVVLQTDLGDMPVVQSDRFQAAASASGRRWSLLIRPGAVRFASGVGLCRTAARIEGYGTTGAGITVRLSLRGVNGRSYPLECPVAATETPATIGRVGEARAVWLEPGACAAVPA